MRDSRPTKKTLPLAFIEIDEGLQMRQGLDQDHVDEMAEHLKDAGHDLPPITVFEGIQGEHGKHQRHYYIGDGNHRLLAYRIAKREHIPVEIRPEQGRAAALRHALGANAEHNALRRTNRDKRKAVLTALRELDDESDRKIAELCRVTHVTVGRIRKELEDNTGETQPKDKAGRDAEQLFLDLYFESKRGLIPSLKRTLDSPDFAAVPADKWGDLAAELRALTEEAEQRAGLTHSTKKG